MRWPTGVPVLALAGCSFLYNPNNLPAVPGEAGIDAPIDAAPVLDSNPSMLAPMDIVPTVLDEGQGDGGSAPALFVIRGHQFTNAGLKVTLTPPVGVAVRLDAVSDAKASHDGNFIAFTVTAHVDAALARDIALDVVVSQDIPAQYDGGVATRPVPGKLTLHGLPELTSTSPGVNRTAKTVTTPLLGRYSMANLTDVTPATFIGAARVDIDAVSSIALGAVIASGVATAAGPGGNPGGMTDGGGLGGGGVGAPAAVLGLGGGGGGGGFVIDGRAGATAQGSGGRAGLHHGNDLLVPLAAHAPSAGGAGGSGLVASTGAGGAGGAGGGMIVLTAGGNVTTGSVAANGGAGSNGAVLLGLGGGGGGGGAGGAVFAASAAGRLAMGTVNVRAGGVGAPGGGAASVGRVRWDAPTGNAPSSPDSAAHRGPTFDVQDRIVTTQRPTLTLTGTVNDGFGIRVTDHDNMPRDAGRGSFNSDGIAAIDPVLRPGYNRVCITLDGGAQGSREADKCIDVAYLP